MKRYIEIANKIKDSKHPNCKVMYLAGSLIRGDGTKYSDLDIVVIYERLEKAYRESFIFDGLMVETFVHDPETLGFFIEKFDKPDSNPSLAQMIAEGVEIPSTSPFSQQLKDKAKESILKGPDHCSEQELLNMRYAITNLVDDIRDYRNESELLGTLTTLYSSLSYFYFKANRYWIGKDKYVSRVLKKIEPELENALSSAFMTAITYNKTEDVIKIAEKILEPYGGFLFDGYRFDAKENMRIKKE